MAKKAEKVEMPDLTKSAWQLLGRMATADVLIIGTRYGTHYETSTRKVNYGHRQKAVSGNVDYQLRHHELIEETGPPNKWQRAWRITRKGKRVWDAYARGQPEEKNTHAPCHGCGSTLKHKKGQVCDECREELRRGRETDPEAQPDLVDFVHVWCSVPQTPFVGGRIGGRNFRIEFQELVWEYLADFAIPEKFDEGAQAMWESPLHGVARYRPWTGKMDPSRLIWLLRLEEVVRLALKEAYRYGYQRGGELLRQLADGEITLDDYEDKLARGRK